MSTKPTSAAISPSDACARALRKDAEANREKIVSAACEVFAESGIDAPLEPIADRAGVGIATLYRRFPNRNDLIEAALLANAELHVEAANIALQREDSWEALSCYLARIHELQFHNRTLADVLTLSLPNCPKVKSIRQQIYDAHVQLIERAQRDGKLRKDFVPEDIILLLLANSGVVETTAEKAPEARKRWFALMLDALRAENASDLPSPPSPRRLISAIRKPRRGRPAGS